MPAPPPSSTSSAARGSTPPCTVVGGGVSGLAAALLLARRGVPVEVLERAPSLGGLAASAAFRGVPCDLGSHRLHPAAIKAPLLCEMASDGLFASRPRRGRLVLGGRTAPYPPRPLPLARALGVKTTLATAAHLLWRRRGPDLDAAPSAWSDDQPGVDQGFEAFVIERVGKAAYDSFYAPYARKVWGLPPAELSQTVAKKRVSTSAPLRALRGGRFLYPRGGMASVIGWFEERLRMLGVPLHTGFDGDPLDREGLVLWSAPLAQLVPTELEHRGLRLVHLALPTERLSRVDTWYVPEAHFDFGRVSELRNFSPLLGRPGETILCVELPQGGHPPEVARSEPDLPTLLEQLRAAGILPRGMEPIEVRQTWLPGVYPLYRRGWRTQWRETLDRSAALERVFPFGRQGLFLHCNLDHCAVIAAELVEHLVDGGAAAPWLARAGEFATMRVRD